MLVVLLPETRGRHSVLGASAPIPSALEAGLRRGVGRESLAPEEDPLRAARGLAWGFALSVPVWLLIALGLWIIAGAA
jgi:hypothetical protein